MRHTDLKSQRTENSEVFRISTKVKTPDRLKRFPWLGFTTIDAVILPNRRMELECGGQPGVEGRNGPRNEARMAQAAERSTRGHSHRESRTGKRFEAYA